jgi:N-acetylmuramoyl-L-alanine amidase
MTIIYDMKIGASVFLFLLLLPSIVFTESASENRITVRASEQTDFVRLVFETQNSESGSSMISRASVNESYSLIKIDFPQDFTLKETPIPESVKLNKKGNSIYLNVATLEKIRVVRLESPPRLVVDAYVSGKDTGAQASAPPATVHTPGKPFRLYVLAIDPGHGGSDQGITFEQSKESSVALNVALTLAKQASSRVQNVTLSRKDDSQLTIEQRIADIRKSHPDILISLHMTRNPNFVIIKSTVASNTGVKIARYTTSFAQLGYIERSHVLAQSIGIALHEQFKLDARQLELPLPLLMAMAMPAVTIELPNSQSFNYTPENVNLISEAILKGIADYAEK